MAETYRVIALVLFAALVNMAANHQHISDGSVYSIAFFLILAEVAAFRVMLTKHLTTGRP